MRSRLFHSLLLACIALATFAAGPRPRAALQTTPPPPRLMPIGGGYEAIYPGLIAAAAANAQAGNVKILVIPSAYSTSAEAISPVERASDLAEGERRRAEVEAACRAYSATYEPPEGGPGLTCSVQLAPILTRAEAADPANVALLDDELAAVFFLGGNPAVAMQTLADTPFESALTESYAQGVIVAGAGAGAAIQSRAFIAGYNPTFTNRNALAFGAADVRRPPEQRGLAFGIDNALIEQYFFQRGRFARLLNAVAQPEGPHVGIGLDAGAGAQITDGRRLENLFGPYGVMVLDAASYHTAAGARYSGPQHLLSLRNVLAHLLAPGPESYDLETRAHSLAPPPERLQRAFSGLEPPAGAGALILGGGLEPSLLAKLPLAAYFRSQSGGPQARLLIVVAGYPSAAEGQRTAEAYAAALDASAITLIVDDSGGETPAPPDPDSYAGLVWIVADPERLPADPAEFEQRYDFIRAAWLSGKPLLADQGAAAAAGAFYSAEGPTPAGAAERELAVQGALLTGQTAQRPGLALLAANFEPRILDDNRWGHWLALGYNHPQQLAVGLPAGAALLVEPGGATVYGEQPALALDLSAATLAQGANEGLVFANGLLDVFAPGERLRPEPANMAAAPAPVYTPALPTVPPTPTPIATDTPVPTITPTPPEETRPPRATPTPVEIPPLPNANLNNLMILITVLGVLIVITGVLINRRDSFDGRVGRRDSHPPKNPRL